MLLPRLARGLVCALLERIESGQLTLVEDGQRRVFGSGSPQATVVIRDPRVWTALRRGGKGFAQSYVDGWWDSPDVTAVVEVAARNLHGIDEFRRRITPGARAVAARAGAARAQHAAARPRRHRRPLRPRQRPVRADARRDDDVLERDLRAPRHAARRGLTGQAGPHLRQARPAAVRPRARDRDRLGRVRAACRADARLPRHDHDPVARAARTGAGACPRGRPGGSRDDPARRLPRAHRDLRQARLDRDDRGRRLEGLRDLLRAVLLAAAPGRRDGPAGDHDRRPPLRRREGPALVHELA